MLLDANPKVGVGNVVNASDVGAKGVDVVRLKRVLVVSIVVAPLQYGQVIVDTRDKATIEV